MRSLLFVPGDNPSMLQNALIFEADKVIIDLEDAVSVNNKDLARTLVKEYLQNCKSLEKIIVRINGLDTPYYQDDLAMLKQYCIFAVMVPKISIDVINEFNKIYNFNLIPIIESALAVTQINELMQYENVIGYLLGAEDLASDLGVNRTAHGEEILYARQKLAYSAIAYKKLAIDTPTTDASNMETVEKDAIKAKSLGLKAKACIHPNQVPIINEIFSVSKEEVIWAQKVLKALETNHKGAFSLDGKMIDEPIIKRAKNILKLANEYGVDA